MMDRPEEMTARKRIPWAGILRGLFLYAFVPALILGWLAGPIGDAARRSDEAASLILLAAAIAVGLNWLVCAVVRRRRPSLLVFAHGVLCLLAVAVIENEAVAGLKELTSTLGIIVGYLTMTFLLLLSFWLASLKNRPAHGIAVSIWIVLWVMIAAISSFVTP